MRTTKKIAVLAVLVSVGMVLSYFESLIPPFVAIPGVKLGLANTVTVFALYILGIPEAVTVSLLRVVLSSLLFGSFTQLLYSTVGAILSLIVMIAAMRLMRLSTVTVSALGGVFHNLGQTLAAVLVLRTLGVFFYFPVLIISGVVAGIVIGTASGILMKRMQKPLNIPKMTTDIDKNK